MGVIGIVSALTLPNLNSSTGDKERVAKVKKIYQNLNDALGRAEAVYGPHSDWYPNGEGGGALTKRTGERITEFMKISKNCGADSNSGCFSTTSYLDGNYFAALDGPSYYKVITADGTSIGFNGKYQVYVDIDGPNKGAHTLGKDVFTFTITSDTGELKPSGYDKNFSEILEKISSKGSFSTVWIINYDNADYLQFQSVSGSTATCKNGNTVTESNPRCK